MPQFNENKQYYVANKGDVIDELFAYHLNTCSQYNLNINRIYQG